MVFRSMVRDGARFYDPLGLVSEGTKVDFQLQINSLFRRGDEKEEWGSAFVTAAGSEGLGPGATTPPIVLKSQNGYTGTDQSRQDMLTNTQFVDAKIQLFAKYGSIQWVRMGEHPIERKLLEK